MKGYFVKFAKDLGFETKAAMCREFDIKVDMLDQAEHRGTYDAKAKEILVKELGLSVDDLMEMWNGKKENCIPTMPIMEYYTVQGTAGSI